MLPTKMEIRWGGMPEPVEIDVTPMSYADVMFIVNSVQQKGRVEEALRVLMSAGYLVTDERITPPWATFYCISGLPTVPERMHLVAKFDGQGNVLSTVCGNLGPGHQLKLTTDRFTLCHQCKACQANCC